MPLIVVLDDEAGTLTLVSQVLSRAGFRVLSAEDGERGLQLIRQHKPDLVISDVQMPRLDGFGVLDAIRRDDALTSTPVILLTSLQDRRSMRQGMTTGADDYLTKPFMPAELLEAVGSQFNKRLRNAALRSAAVTVAISEALGAQRHSISKLYEKRTAREMNQQWTHIEAGPESEQFASATALYASIRNFGQWSQHLPSEDMADLLRHTYGAIGDVAHLFGVRHIQFLGDGMLCIFVDRDDSSTVNHGMRAARAAVALGHATRHLTSFVRESYKHPELPRRFTLVCALHTGPLTLAKLVGVAPVGQQRSPVGDPVAVALQMFKGQPELDWKIAASVQTSRLIAGAFALERRALVQMPGRQTPLDVVEISGLEHWKDRA